METRANQLPEGNRNAKPLYRQAAERLARHGEDVETFLARNDDAIGNPRFPGPDCIHPDEIASYRQTARLPEHRTTHLAACEACSAMVEAALKAADAFPKRVWKYGNLPS